ncbi:hypothetical protein BOX15_Mlig028326g1, partial [Macrostomum lignano]
PSIKMSLIIPANFKHIIRISNTNIDGKVMARTAMTSIKGVGRRYSDLVAKRAGIGRDRRAGQLSDDEIEQMVTIIMNPQQFKIPHWVLNRQKDIKDMKHRHVISNQLDTKLREDLERLKRVRAHRGLRHYWTLRVRGQHTKTTGRRGRTVGVSKKK